MASAAGSLFARLYAGHTGVDPYTTAVSDTYQDLFDEGIFTGKGLYDVDAFVASLRDRVPENTLLSHDLFEGLYARTALVTDVEVVDDYPSSVLAHAKRQHRWVRGDWQILCWLLPVVPTRSGWQRNQLPLIARWKIFDNLRRSLMAPATVALLLAGWTVLPGSPLAWTAVALAPVAFPVADQVVALLATLWRPARWRAQFDDLRMAAGARGAAGRLPGERGVRTAARDRRHARPRRRSRASACSSGKRPPRRRSRGGTPRVGGVREGHDGEPARRGRRGRRCRRDQSARAARRAAVLWPCGWRRRRSRSSSSRPAPSRREVLDADDRAFLRAVALKTWRYFETFGGPADHALPPDNVQMMPEPRVAHRTSPTNIAMALLATVSAHDLGFIDVDDMAERLDAT